MERTLTVLSLFDERSRPKGSRDPLGIEAIWSTLGRQVVGNLTTVTHNLSNFIVALLCCHHANGRPGELDEIQERFLRAEQLAAYLRLAGGDGGFLGITRAKANWQQGQGRPALGRGEQAQILSNQLSYGLWGLYSSAMQIARLIDGAERRPTEAGRKLAEQAIARLGDANWQAFVALSARAEAPSAEVERLGGPFRAMLADPAIRQAFVQALLGWQREGELQSELYAQAGTYLGSVPGASASARRFCEWLLERDEISPALREAMQQIRAVEPLLVLAATLMSWLQGQRGQTRQKLVEQLAPLLAGIGFADDWQRCKRLPYRDFLDRLMQAAQAGDAAGLMNGLLEHNGKVMRQRGGAPWLEWEGDKLKVRMPNDRPHLPESLVKACSRWDNSYFITSFLSIAKEGAR